MHTDSFDAIGLQRRDMRERELEAPEGVALGANLLVRSRTLFKTGDGSTAGGVWESEPGTARFEFLEFGELVYLISGRIVVTSDTGEQTILTPGTCASFPPGWTGTWVMEERSRKFAVSFHGAPVRSHAE